MADILSIEIQIGDATRVVTVDPSKVTLGFHEDLENAKDTGKWTPLISAFASLLKLTKAEAREITIEQFTAIGAALNDGIREQTTLPKE